MSNFNSLLNTVLKVDVESRYYDSVKEYEKACLALDKQGVLYEGTLYRVPRKAGWIGVISIPKS